MMTTPKHHRRLAKARIRGKWYFVTEYDYLPEQSIVVRLDGDKHLIPKEDWYEVDPMSSEATEAWGRIHAAEIDNHPPTCFCPACRRLRQSLRWNHYSVRDRIEFVILGIFLMGAIVICVWGLWAILALD